MKRIFKVIVIILLSIFSFYYTDKIVYLSKKNDPIMIKIEEAFVSNKLEPIEAIVGKDSMIVGKSGKIVDNYSSYEKMKKMDKYNESFLVYTNIKPKIIKSNNYDKYIIGVNTLDREISLIFRFDNLDYFDDVIYILNKNGVSATFYMDYNLVSNNYEKMKSIFNDKFSLGIYSYNNVFNSTSVLYSNKLLNSFKNSNYCLYKDDNYLDICKSFKINTIKPFIVSKNLYSFFKYSKENGMIYEIIINKDNIRELNSTLSYLISKGYDIKLIDDLLKE